MIASDKQWDEDEGECTHGMIGNYFTCNGDKRGCTERVRFEHCCYHLKQEHNARAPIEKAGEVCVCGTPSEPFIIHRTDGPCAYPMGAPSAENRGEKA